MRVTETTTVNTSPTIVFDSNVQALMVDFATGGAVSADDTTEEERGAAWEGILAIEGSPTSDRRYLLPGEMDHRDLPVPLMVQTVNEDGHTGAETAGRIEKITVIPVSDFHEDGFDVSGLRPEASVIWGEGTFDTSPFASEAERMIENGAGVSIDPTVDRWALIDPETFEEVPEEDVSMEDVLMGNYLQGFGGKIAGATIVTIPAFEEASIRVSDGKVLVASGYGLRLKQTVALVASAAPLKPPRSWFDPPTFMRLTPLTITKEGRVFGHLCDWDGCHTGFGNVCVPPFRSHSNFAYFNVGEIETAEGDMVPVGKLMFSRTDTGHADTNHRLSVDDVRQHYDDATRVGGYVRAGEDRFGTYLVGCLRHDLSDEDIQHIRLNPPSGDWRPIPGKGSELVAAFSVPVPGFPIPRSLVACGNEGDLTIITGPLNVQLGARARRRRHMMLRERLAALNNV
jgi:hypothetical protein